MVKDVSQFQIAGTVWKYCRLYKAGIAECPKKFINSKEDEQAKEKNEMVF